MKNKAFSVAIASVIIVAIVVAAGAVVYTRQNKAPVSSEDTVIVDEDETPEDETTGVEITEPVATEAPADEEEVEETEKPKTTKAASTAAKTDEAEEAETEQTTTETTVKTGETTTQKAGETTTKKAKGKDKTTTKATAETTVDIKKVAEKNDYDIGKTSTPVQTSSGTLPKDMSFAGLYFSGYDIIGRKPYIFNDDKNATQSKFGYNRFYDKAAKLLDFHIDTCRIHFDDYDGRDWMVQLWKGTYITGDIGTVGGEVGLYNRKAGKRGGAVDHYECATEPDWLNMEMTLFWDENYDNNFLPQFTRTYGRYWWPTGFVDGQLRNRNDTSCLRVVCRITFKDTVMSQKFADALENVGFTSVSTFDPFRRDTYKRYACDVIFCWQNARD